MPNSPNSVFRVRLPKGITTSEIEVLFGQWCIERGLKNTYHKSKGEMPLYGAGFMELLKIAGVIKPEESSEV